MTSHLLSWIIFSPLIGAFAVLLAPQRLSKAIATAASFFVCVLALVALCHFNPNDPGLQMIEKVSWIPQFNVSYFLATDGISFPMILLTALISFIACVASYGIKERQKEYFFLYLLLETGMMGTFLALDIFLFYVFWEVVLLPMYFLIGIWGGPRREYAAIKFFLYTLAGSLLMLLGILSLYFASTPHTFNWLELSQTSFSLGFQKWIFLAFFFGFAIKVPIWPFHTWLPDAHVEAPTPISVILAGVLLKMGTYGFFRFSFALAPQGAVYFQSFLSILAVIGIVYGGFVALAQTDLKKMVAYSSVSHMGFVVLGLAAMTQNGFNGALLQMFNHGTITGGLFLLVGVIYDRAHTRDMNSFGGLGAQVPVFAGLLTFFAMASLGLPTLSGFISEFLVLLGSYQYSKLFTAISCLGIILAAAYLLMMIRKVLLGPLNPKWKDHITDVNGREVFTLVPLMILIVVFGLYPSWLLNLMIPTLKTLLLKVTGAA